MDRSETSARAFDTALALARETGAELQPLYVVDAPTMTFDAPGYDPTIVRNAFLEEGTHVVGKALERMKRGGVRGSPRTVEADPVGDDIAHCILHASADMGADLIVMGTHGRHGFRRFVLGSVAERFLHIATCPVLLIPVNHPTHQLSTRAQTGQEPANTPARKPA